MLPLLVIPGKKGKERRVRLTKTEGWERRNEGETGGREKEGRKTGWKAS